MKPTRPRRKMSLHREVLRDLTPAEARQVAGGISVGTCTACRESYCCSRPCGGPTNHPTLCSAA